MARFVASVNVGENVNVTYKIADAGITDNDINKPVKGSAADTVALCSDGDEIYGFINSVERHTADGKVVVGVQISGRRWVVLDGAAAVGTLVEAAANTAAGTANAATWGKVSAKSAVSANIADAATGAQIATAVNALLADALVAKKQWLVISGAGTDGTVALIEKQ